jgi:hypothetical protein
MNRIALLGLSVTALINAQGTVFASTAPISPGFPDFVSTGEQSFTIDPFTSATFSSDARLLGGQRVDVAVAGNIGPDIAALLTFLSDTFKVKYEVQGGGNVLVFSDTVAVKVSATLNGAPLGDTETFNVFLSDQCGDPSQTPALLDCSTRKLLTAFDSSQPVVIPAGTPASELVFNYDVLQSDEHCLAETFSGGILQSEGACLDGGTTVTDTSDLFDPRWSASVSVPEPSVLALLAIFGASALSVGKRRRPLLRS